MTGFRILRMPTRCNSKDSNWAVVRGIVVLFDALRCSDPGAGVSRASSCAATHVPRSAARACRQGRQWFRWRRTCGGRNSVIG